MGNFWKREDVRFLILVAVAGFGFILLSKWLSSIESEGYLKNILWFGSLLAKEGGVALMIAAALGYTVESIVRDKNHQEQEKFKQQISENVLSAVFKKIVPDSIFDEIKRGVLEQTLISRDSCLRYDLKELSHEESESLGLEAYEHGNYLACEVTTKNTLVNLSEAPIKGHEIKAGVSCDLHSSLAKQLRIHHVTIKNLNNGDELTLEGDKLQEYINDDGEGLLTFTVRYDLMPSSSYQITVCSKTFKRVADADVWTTLLPTENMRVTISYPSTLKVFAKSNHSKKLREEPTNPYLSEKEYVLEHGIFPHQGIAFWWRLVR